MAPVHILNQYIWPDSAPTGIYAGQLAEAIQQRGAAVRLVGGSGSYRAGNRPEPAVPWTHLPHWQGRRGSHVSTFREYLAVNGAFRDYIRREVNAGEVVIVTSAPPNTITLHESIRRRGATGIYWLQDYYPDLVRGVIDYPAPVSRMAGAWWAFHLGKWDHVVKAAGNLPGKGGNYRVLRNWPTLDFSAAPEISRTRTALYTGNLGYGHDIGLFAEKCRELHGAGYELAIHADGPGVKRLPEWISARPPFRSERDLLQALLTAEVHLVAAHPAIRHAVFPSKIWNSIGAGARIEASGFAGAMQEELQHVLTHYPHANLAAWVDFVIGLVNPATVTQNSTRE